MARAVRIRHQDTDVMADRLVFEVTELPLCGAAEELHDATAVDHDHRIRNGFQDRAKMAFPCSKCFLNLFLIVDIDHDSAEMAGFSLFVPYDATARPNPVAELRFAAYPVLQVETATRLDGSHYGLLGVLAFFRVKKGKEHLVGKRQIVGYAKKGSGRIRPKQLMR